MIEATKDNFHELVSEGVTLVDVWGTSCAPCMAMMPDVERFAEERSDDLKVVKLEAAKARRLMMELKLMGLPAFLLYRDGEEIGRLAGGDVTFDKMRSWVDDTLSSATV